MTGRDDSALVDKGNLLIRAKMDKRRGGLNGGRRNKAPGTGELATCRRYYLYFHVGVIEVSEGCWSVPVPNAIWLLACWMIFLARHKYPRG